MKDIELFEFTTFRGLIYIIGLTVMLIGIYPLSKIFFFSYVLLYYILISSFFKKAKIYNDKIVVFYYLRIFFRELSYRAIVSRGKYEM